MTHDRGVGRTDHEFSAAGLQAPYLTQHLFALCGRGERTHRDPLGARIAEDDPRGQPLADRGDDVVDGSRRHDRATDGRALLPGLRGHLGDELLDVGIELGRAGDGIRPEDRGVYRVGLAREAHASRLHALVRAQLLCCRRRTGEGHEVAEPQLVEEIGHAAGDELQRARGEQTGLDHHAHHRLGEIPGRGRRLHQGGDPGEECGSELLQRPQTGKLKALICTATPRSRV